ncbi:MAG: Rieske 2Fe-2S domain-containing protein [Planctomycetes bacterium]|nr:Rieske 2Fe-2S domain-containing protein [Planctomycetota bacterium]
MGNFVKVAARTELAPGVGRCVNAGGREIAIFNVNGVFHALDNTCPHVGGPLGEGDLAGSVITCPWHGWQFDVTTGECKSGMKTRATSLPVKVVGDEILVEV